MVEVSDDGVEATGCQCAHLQGGADAGSSAPDAALASTGTAVSVERRHTDQRGDPLAAESAQLRQVCQKRQ